jgi:dipeptidyl aminopeptidase/acylaminoacyl peptidase
VSGEAIQITHSGDQEYHPKWSFNGKSIYCTYRGKANSPQIKCIDLATKKEIKISTGLKGDHYFNFFPRPLQMVFDAGDEKGRLVIWKMDLKTMNKELILGDHINFHPCVSADGNQLTYSSLKSGNTDIWILDLKTRKTKQVTTHPDTDYHPVWSPDGGHILFQSKRSGNFDLWEYNVIGGNPKQLTDSEEYDGNGTYSADGRFIAYTNGPRPQKGGQPGRRDIWIQSLKTGNKVKVTHKFDNSWPDWHPKENKIVYVSTRKNNMDLFVLDISRQIKMLD